MSTKKVSNSYLDYFLVPLSRNFYHLLNIPKSVNPKSIVILGNLVAMMAGISFYLTEYYWFFGLFAAIAVLLNQLLDMLDGTHARHTNQCTNSGEILDHLLDPLGFCYWIIGIGFLANSLLLSIICILVLYTTALLAIQYQRFSNVLVLSVLGPTEFRFSVAFFGLLSGLSSLLLSSNQLSIIAFLFLSLLLFIYTIMLIKMYSMISTNVDHDIPVKDRGEWSNIHNTKKI